MSPDEAKEAKQEMIATAKQMIAEDGYQAAMTRCLSISMAALTKFGDDKTIQALFKVSKEHEEKLAEAMMCQLMAMAVWAEIASIDLTKMPGESQPETAMN